MCLETGLELELDREVGVILAWNVYENVCMNRLKGGEKEFV